MEATVINGKSGTVNITAADEVSVIDNNTKSNYVVKNKKDENYGVNSFHFHENSGTDTIKGYEYDDKIYFEDGAALRFSKKGTSNDLVINKNYDEQTKKYKDTITLKDYFKSEGLNNLYIDYVNVTGSGKINGTDYSDEITGSNKADTIKTGYGSDYIEAGKGNDTIIAGDGFKTLFINKGDGNDIIKKEEDTSNIRSAKRYIEDGVNLVFEHEVLRGVEVEKDEITYTFTKTLGDLKVTATHSDGKSESVTVKDYFDTELFVIHKDSEFDVAKVNYEDDVDEILEETGVLVNSVKLSQILKEFKLSEMINKLGVKIPGALNNVNVFLGSDYDDSFVGTTGKDLMIAEGGNNDFTTGSKGQTVIASLGYEHGRERALRSEIPEANGNDTYNVNSFTAGTVIVDAGGENELTVSGVDVNDIHMASFMNKEIESESSVTNILSNLDIAYFTDKKGVKNIAGINFNGIYNKVMDTIQNARYNPTVEDIDEKTLAKIQKQYKYGTEQFDESGYNNAIDKKLSTMKEAHMKTAIKDINSLLTTASGLIDKFRGVGIIAGKDEYDGEELERKGSDILQKDITVVDTNKNEQTISVENMATYQDMMEDRMESYLYRMQYTYYDHIAKVMDDEEYELDTIKGFAQYIVEAPNSDKFTSADKKIYNAIKSGFFALYDNAFIGTSGDNNYTFTNADDGAMVVSGTGNDTFTFKGSLMNKKEASIRPEPKRMFYSGQTYDIVSNIRKAQEETPDTPATQADKDVIKVSNYSFDDRTLSMPAWQDNFDMDEETGNVYFKGLSLTAVDYKKNNYATIKYGIDEQFYSGALIRKEPLVLAEREYTGYDVTKDNFDNLTIIDSKKEYSVIAKYNAEEVVCNWSGDDNKGKNHIAMLKSMDTTVKSNDGTNIISVSSFNYEEGTPNPNRLAYTYGGGNDMVYSTNYNSDDIYNVEFDKNTKLIISDEDGEDEMNITADVSKLKLFFNVDNDGDYDNYEFQFIASDNLKKSNFSVLKMNGYTEVVTDKGIVIDYGNIEKITIKDGEDSFVLATKNAADAIAQEVAGWLNNNSKGYADVDEVLAKGTKSEITQVLAIYDKYDLSQFPSEA